MTASQPSLFDAPLAALLRDLGIRRADEHADPDWKDAALYAVWLCAQRNREFIVDDVWSYIPDGYDTHENRAMGAVMRRAHDRGWIEATDAYHLSKRPGCHRNPRRVWRSRV